MVSRQHGDDLAFRIYLCLIYGHRSDITLGITHAIKKRFSACTTHIKGYMTMTTRAWVTTIAWKSLILVLTSASAYLGCYLILTSS